MKYNYTQLIFNIYYQISLFLKFMEFWISSLVAEQEVFQDFAQKNYEDVDLQEGYE